MENRVFLRLANREFQVTKEYYTSLVAMSGPNTIWNLNPEKNLYEEYQRYYAGTTLEEIEESFEPVVDPESAKFIFDELTKFTEILAREAEADAD